jgi:hypothetical protein
VNIDTLEELGVKMDEMDYVLHLYQVGGRKWKAEVLDLRQPSSVPVWHNELELSVRELILATILFAQQART